MVPVRNGDGDGSGRSPREARACGRCGAPWHQGSTVETAKACRCSMASRQLIRSLRRPPPKSIDRQLVHKQRTVYSVACERFLILFRYTRLSPRFGGTDCRDHVVCGWQSTTGDLQVLSRLWCGVIRPGQTGAGASIVKLAATAERTR